MGGKEVSEAVVKVAWAAQQETELKALLAAEVLENDKLRKSVEVYKKVIEDLELADDDDAAAAASNSDSASTELCQEPGTPDMYVQLRDKLSSSEFLEQLASNEGAKPLDSSVLGVGGMTSTMITDLHALNHDYDNIVYNKGVRVLQFLFRNSQGVGLHCGEITIFLPTPLHLFFWRKSADQEAGAWLVVSDDKIPAKEERDGLGTSEGYVVITQQDIVDGVACFVARSISSLPQSKSMNPDELQQAIISAFSELQKTGKLRNLWNCAHLLYAATSWGSTALGLYKNPVIRRAAWMAVYTTCSIILRLFP